MYEYLFDAIVLVVARRNGMGWVKGSEMSMSGQLADDGPGTVAMASSYFFFHSFCVRVRWHMMDDGDQARKTAIAGLYNAISCWPGLVDGRGRYSTSRRHYGV